MSRSLALIFDAIIQMEVVFTVLVVQWMGREIRFIDMTYNTNAYHLGTMTIIVQEIASPAVVVLPRKEEPELKRSGWDQTLQPNHSHGKNIPF